MKAGSLFSGGGGLDLGLERAGMEFVWQVEIDEPAIEVLKKQWPGVRRYRDIKDFNAILSSAGFHARTYQLPEGVPDYRESVLVSGGKCWRPFAWYDQGTSSWRTWQCSLTGEWVRYSDPWPLAGIIRNGIAYRRLPSGRSIDVTGSSLYRTPDANLGLRGPKSKEGYEDSLKNGTHAVNLLDQITHDFFPTPCAQDFKRRGPNSKQQGLPEVIRMDTSNRSFPSGTGDWSIFSGKCLPATEWLLPFPVSLMTFLEANPDYLLTGRSSGAGALNPAWVEWLMGFPIGWTDCESSETPSSLKSLNSSESGSLNLIGGDMNE